MQTIYGRTLYKGRPVAFYNYEFESGKIQSNWQKFVLWSAFCQFDKFRSMITQNPRRTFSRENST